MNTNIELIKPYRLSSGKVLLPGLTGKVMEYNPIKGQTMLYVAFETMKNWVQINKKYTKEL